MRKHRWKDELIKGDPTGLFDVYTLLGFHVCAFQQPQFGKKKKLLLKLIALRTTNKEMNDFVFLHLYCTPDCLEKALKLY